MNMIFKIGALEISIRKNIGGDIILNFAIANVNGCIIIERGEKDD